MTDQERDAHLREALRHAPDAQLQPPPSLSELILSEARAKTRDAVPPRPAPRSPLAAVWDWLARPAVAAGFAGVMVATLVGVMWWDQPMDEALPRRPELAGTTATAPAPAAPPATSTADIAPKPAPAAEPAPPRVAQRKEAAAADKKAAEEKSDKLKKTETRPAAPAPVQPTMPPEPLRQRDAEVTAQAPPAAAAVAPAPAPERESAPAMASGRVADSVTPAELPRAARAKATPSAAVPAVPEQNFVARERGVAAALDSSTGRYALTVPPLTALRTQITHEPAAWSWQRGDGSTHAMDNAVVGWLARLDTSASTNWKPRTAAADSSPPRGRELRLLRDGHELHVMRIVGDAVLWEREGSPLQLVLPPATLDALQSSLDLAAP